MIFGRLARHVRARFYNNNIPRHDAHGLPIKGHVEVSIGGKEYRPLLTACLSWEPPNPNDLLSGSVRLVAKPERAGRGAVELAVSVLTLHASIGTNFSPLADLAERLCKRYVDNELRVSVHSGALWWDLFTQGRWHSGLPWWRQGSLQFADWLLGPGGLKGEWEFRREHDLELRDAKGAVYKMHLAEYRGIWGRPRWELREARAFEWSVFDADGKELVNAWMHARGTAQAIGEAVADLVEDLGLEIFEAPLPGEAAPAGGAEALQ